MKKTNKHANRSGKEANPWNISRRGFLSVCAAATAGAAAMGTAAGTDLLSPRVESTAQAGRHWSMAIDVDKCIGCGRCVAACRAENRVPEGFYRTWIERYVITNDGQVHVDSPNGGEFGFPDSYDLSTIRRSFHVPKLCNLCGKSACTQVCPVGATFESPEGVTLVDYEYCIGCAYCVQACPYGCRFINPERQTADKCTLCYHRISRGMRPACVEACPTGARIFGDLNEVEGDVADADYPDFAAFIQTHNVQVLKPHLGTHPRVFYKDLDLEVR